MSDYKIIDLTPENISEYGVCGYKDVKKHLELQKKIQWFGSNYSRGLRIKIVISEKGGYQGMIEYLPGELACRPVDAKGYMFINCIFTGFKKEYKNLGYGTAIIEECIEEAKEKNMLGVASVTRKGSFMASDDIFIRMGFEIADERKPDFHLVVKKFNSESKSPEFRKDTESRLEEYSEGLTILRSPQCPYTEKNVREIIKTAKEMYLIEAKIVELETPEAVQKSPCPFGSFCIIWNGEIISHHPISNTRFINIMKNKIK